MENLGLDREKVRLVPHSPAWAGIYKDEEMRLRRLLTGANLVDVQHFGSTAIPGILAKPLISILAVVEDLSVARAWIARLADAGYAIREDTSEHLLFAKGPAHRRIIHIHMAEQGSDYVEQSLAFRDYLLAHPAVAKEYEKLKVRLAQAYPNQRRAYTRGKNNFIKAIIGRAQAEGK